MAADARCNSQTDLLATMSRFIGDCFKMQMSMNKVFHDKRKYKADMFYLNFV